MSFFSPSLFFPQSFIRTHTHTHRHIDAYYYYFFLELLFIFQTVGWIFSTRTLNSPYLYSSFYFSYLLFPLYYIFTFYRIKIRGKMKMILALPSLFLFLCFFLLFPFFSSFVTSFCFLPYFLSSHYFFSVYFREIFNWVSTTFKNWNFNFYFRNEILYPNICNNFTFFSHDYFILPFFLSLIFRNGKSLSNQ